MSTLWDIYKNLTTQEIADAVKASPPSEGPRRIDVPRYRPRKERQGVEDFPCVRVRVEREICGTVEVWRRWIVNVVGHPPSWWQAVPRRVTICVRRINKLIPEDAYAATAICIALHETGWASEMTTPKLIFKYSKSKSVEIMIEKILAV